MNVKAVFKFKEYIKNQREELYPRVLVPNIIQKILTAKLEEKTASRIGSVTLWASALGVLSLVTPLGLIGLIGAGAAIFYDYKKGYLARKVVAEEENRRIREITSNPKLFRKYMNEKIIEALSSIQSDLTKSDAKFGRHDTTLLNSLKKIPNCLITRGKGLCLGYFYTPDVILHVPNLNLWIDIEVDEPWFLTDFRQREPIHYIGKDDYRDKKFVSANWVVFRFAEEQVSNQPHSCAKEIARFLELFNIEAISYFQDVPDLTPVKRWKYEEALQRGRTIGYSSRTVEKAEPEYLIWKYAYKQWNHIGYADKERITDFQEDASIKILPKGQHPSSTAEKAEPEYLIWKYEYEQWNHIGYADKKQIADFQEDASIKILPRGQDP